MAFVVLDLPRLSSKKSKAGSSNSNLQTSFVMQSGGSRTLQLMDAEETSHSLRHLKRGSRNRKPLGRTFTPEVVEISVENA